MRRILLLTKCQYGEEQIEKVARKLGHELFCSASILDAIKYDKLPIEFLEQFQILLISETITNKECSELVEKLEDNLLIVIQLCSQPLTKEEQERKRQEGIDYCLLTTDSLEKFREVFCKKPTGRTQTVLSIAKGVNYSIDELTEMLSLTKKEQKVFHELMAADGRIVSREDICRRIWKIEPNQSTQSQVSTLVKKIKAKMEKIGLNSRCITTHWGLGYMLDSSLLYEQPKYGHTLLYQVQ